jgi:hypothetical protein
VSSIPLVYADLQNVDAQGRLRLNCVGTVNDLSRQQVQLREGLTLNLYADDADAQGQKVRLFAQGAVTYSTEEACWVAVIDWEKIRHVPEMAAGLRLTSGQVVSPSLTTDRGSSAAPNQAADRQHKR